MKQAVLALIVITAAISGCENRPNYSQQVLDRPLPQTDQKRQEECNLIRSEIARQQSLAQAGGAIATTPMMAIAVQAKVRDNIAALESRAANVQCSASFSNTPVSTKPAFDECFSKCKEYTSRTKEQCFDACNK